MKRILALTLAAIMIAAGLASCAIASTRTASAISAKIRLASSDAENAASWLTERLGAKLIDRVVLGTSADGYGVDLSKLEADGYVIRTLGDEIALFARTADGLDRAVRKYAKAVEAGEAIADETYHEGARIERFTIAGNDISTYAITVEGEWEYLKKWVTSYAAQGFSDLVNYACNVRVPFGDAEHKIIFRETDDESFEEATYSYRVENGDLIFEYSDKMGANYGVNVFLEDECGWEQLTFGDDELAESDHVDVAEGLNVTVTPLFDEGLNPYDAGYGRKFNIKTSLSGATNGMYGTYFKIAQSCHGFTSYKWGGYESAYHTNQLCYSSESIYGAVKDAILDYIDAQLAAGKKIGDDLNFIDVSQGDNYRYCSCNDCIRTYGEENGAWSGTVVRWANRLAEEAEEEGYGGLKYGIFAYAGSNKPCLTKPRADVYVTYVINGNCYRHFLDGSQCTGSSFDMAGAWGRGVRLNNNDFGADWMKGWGELCDQGNYYLWAYTLSNPIRDYTMIARLYEDLHFASECGVDAVFNEGEIGTGITINAIHHRLTVYLQLHPDITKQEYIEVVGRMLEKEYGDGWRDIYRAIDLWEEAQIAVDSCDCCWGYAGIIDYGRLDWNVYSAHWDEMLSLIEGAFAGTCCAAQDTALKKLSITYLYNGCFAEFFKAYEAGDTETLAKLEERWSLLLKRFGEVGLDYHSFREMGGTFSLYDTLEESAFRLWLDERAKFFPAGTELSPVPDEYLDPAE